MASSGWWCTGLGMSVVGFACSSHVWKWILWLTSMWTEFDHNLGLPRWMMIDCLPTADSSITGMFHLCMQTKLAFIRGSNGILSFLRFQTFSKAHMLHTDMVLALGTGCWEDCYVFFPIWMDFLTTSGRWKLPSWRFVTSFCFYRGSTPFERELPSYVTDVAASPAISVPPWCLFARSCSLVCWTS